MPKTTVLLCALPLLAAALFNGAIEWAALAQPTPGQLQIARGGDCELVPNCTQNDVCVFVSSMESHYYHYTQIGFHPISLSDFGVGKCRFINKHLNGTCSGSPIASGGPPWYICT